MFCRVPCRPSILRMDFMHRCMMRVPMWKAKKKLKRLHFVYFKNRLLTLHQKNTHTHRETNKIPCIEPNVISLTFLFYDVCAWKRCRLCQLLATFQSEEEYTAKDQTLHAITISNEHGFSVFFLNRQLTYLPHIDCNYIQPMWTWKLRCSVRKKMDRLQLNAMNLLFKDKREKIQMKRKTFVFVTNSN